MFLKNSEWYSEIRVNIVKGAQATTKMTMTIKMIHRALLRLLFWSWCWDGGLLRNVLITETFKKIWAEQNEDFRAFFLMQYWFNTYYDYDRNDELHNTWASFVRNPASLGPSLSANEDILVADTVLKNYQLLNLSHVVHGSACTYGHEDHTNNPQCGSFQCEVSSEMEIFIALIPLLSNIY